MTWNLVAAAWSGVRLSRVVQLWSFAFVGMGGHSHGQEPAILVTHQVNVTALTGVYPGDGEMVVMRPGPDGHVVAGRLTLARA